MYRPERPRVALFTYGTQSRGGVVHAIELGEALHRRDTPVVVFGIDDAGTGFFRTPRCPHVVVPIERRTEDIVSFVRRRIDAYVRALGERGDAFDIYHAGDGISANALTTLVERGRIPHFLRTVHHVDTFSDPDLAALHTRSIHGAARTFAVSRLWQRRLEEIFGIGAAIVPNGVDAARFSPVAADERARLRSGLGFGNGPLFLTIGGIEARKNTIATLEAFGTVRRSHPSATLAIAGGASIFDHSPYRTRFETRASHLGLRLGRDVRMLGPVPDDEIVSLLRAAHALVFPSLVEGFGLVALEALACETPLVTSRIAPFTEYLSDGDALLVNPHAPAEIAAAMLQALDVRRAAALARNGRRVAQAFSLGRERERASAALPIVPRDGRGAAPCLRCASWFAGPTNRRRRAIRRPSWFGDFLEVGACYPVPEFVRRTRDALENRVAARFRKIRFPVFARGRRDAAHRALGGAVRTASGGNRSGRSLRAAG